MRDGEIKGLDHGFKLQEGRGQEPETPDCDMRDRECKSLDHGFKLQEGRGQEPQQPWEGHGQESIKAQAKEPENDQAATEQGCPASESTQEGTAVPTALPLQGMEGTPEEPFSEFEPSERQRQLERKQEQQPTVDGAGCKRVGERRDKNLAWPEGHAKQPSKKQQRKAKKGVIASPDLCAAPS